MGLDSVELIMEIENHFQINFKDDDIRNVHTIKDLSELTYQILKITSDEKNEFIYIHQSIQEYLGKEIKLNDFIFNHFEKNQFNELSETLQLDIPNHTSNRFTRFFNYHFINWNELTFEDFINGIVIKNKDLFFIDNLPLTKYGIYIKIGRIIRRIIASPYYDIQPRANITKDLRID